MGLTPAKQLLKHLESCLATGVTPDHRLAVGYSGGRDSSVLLALCCRLRPGMVTALYVDHGWRPPQERLAERQLVQRVCQQLPCALVIFEAPTHPSSTSGGREALARDHRYACFERYHADHPDERILLAHHAQDQAETILMRLLQGRSWQGLSGIPEFRGPYLRPFLDVWPQDLDAVVRELGLTYWFDSTNAEESALRNTLRHRVFPLLESVVPGASRSLVRFGSVWSELQPGTVVDPGWEISEGRASLARAVWESWSPLERGNQLQCVASQWKAGRRPRRLVDALLRGGEAAGLRLRLEKSVVVWETVVKLPGLQYFRETPEGQPVHWEWGEVSWSSRAGDFLLDGGPGKGQPTVFVASHDTGAVRHGSSVFQDALSLDDKKSLPDAVFWLVGTEVRGVFDPKRWRWLWKPEPVSGGLKMWVTLRRRAYER